MVQNVFVKRFIFLILIVMIATVTTGCGSSKNDSDLNSTGSNLDCKSSIQDYLAKADLKGRGDREIKDGDNIVVDYIGRLDDEQVFDTSVESIAKACGKYAAGRDYNSGLPFQVGGGKMIAGFDIAVKGMKVGQTKTVNILAKDAYGEISMEKFITVEKSKIPNADQYEVGMYVQADFGQMFRVSKVTKTDITFDANHELAGKDLIFDITIKEIK